MQTPDGEFSLLSFPLHPKNDNQFPSANFPEGDVVVNIHSTNAYFGRNSAQILFAGHKSLPDIFNLVDIT